MYELLEINKPDDLDQLGAVLEKAHDAGTVIGKLKAKLSGRCRKVLVEHSYVDKDYRSTYYNFYAKKGYRYDSSCVRLHFFDERAQLIDGHHLTSHDPTVPLAAGYFGFMVLRPTNIQTIGRTVLSPDIIDGFNGEVITSRFKVHVLGKRLEVQGFPFMSQHSDVSVCAHVACWAILRHYSERFPAYRELLTHDVTRLAHEFDPGGLLPSLGLGLPHAERVFSSAGTFPLVVAKELGNERLFKRQLLAYVESGFPVFAAMSGREHAIAVIGHGEWLPAPVKSEPLYFASDLVSSMVVVDDNHFPYLSIDGASGGCGYGVDDIDAFIVPLPEKLYYPADAVDHFAGLIASDNYLGFDHSALGPLTVRYFVTTSAALRQFLDANRSQFDPELVRVAMQLVFPQFVWIVELSSLDQWTRGQVATRMVLDATASCYETNPLFIMHNSTQAYVCDRGGDHGDALLTLGGPVGSVLSRMPGDLRRR